MKTLLPLVASVPDGFLRAYFIICAALLAPAPYFLWWLAMHDWKLWPRLMGLGDPFPSSERERTMRAVIVGWAVVLVVMALFGCLLPAL